MKKFLVAVAALACMGSVAFAGPNLGGTLFVHDANYVYDFGDTYCGVGTPPQSCEGADTDIYDDTNIYQVWKVYAAFAPCSAPRLKALDFSVHYDAFDPDNGTGLVILGLGNCLGDPDNGAAEYQGPGWPSPGSGTVCVFQFAQTGTLAEVYWFAGYAYYGSPTVFSVGPGQYGGKFADDSSPLPLEDDIAGFGGLGFNVPGFVSCPGAAAQGACCIGQDCSITCESECQGDFQGQGTTCDPNPCVEVIYGACCVGLDCYFVSEEDCARLEGLFYPNVPCDPTPCEPVPVEVQSWGQIKSNYR